MKKVLRLFSRFFLIWICVCSILRAQESYPEIIKIAGIKPGMIVGEVGSGSGAMASAMADVVGSRGRIYANEISPESLEYIKGKGIKNITTVLGNVNDPLFPRTDLDMVIMENVFHDLENPSSMLENIKRYMKKNALLVIIEKFPDKTASPAPGTFHSMPKEHFFDILQRSSFRPASPDVGLSTKKRMYFFGIDPGKERKVWDNWMAELKEKVNDLVAFEKKVDISPARKRIAWERLFNSFRDDNPETGQDEVLRNFICERIEQLSRSSNKPPEVQYEQLDAERILQIIEKAGFKDFNVVSGDFPNQYTRIMIGGDSIVIDEATRLAWHATGSPGALNYFEALEFVEGLNENKFAGFSNWRLPKVEELITLIETDKKRDGIRINNLFSAEQASCWTGDYPYPGRARIVNFEPSIIPVWEILKTNRCWVRPVRSLNR
jgi:ubiquinone/menaquinone biosynthesis C-methylase UbiE